jgi:hypothetical protein
MAAKPDIDGSPSCVTAFAQELADTAPPVPRRILARDDGICAVQFWLDRLKHRSSTSTRR